MNSLLESIILLTSLKGLQVSRIFYFKSSVTTHTKVLNGQKALLGSHKTETSQERGFKI